MDMMYSSEDGNFSRNIQSQKRDQTRSGTLLDLDVLDCPICCEPLTIPIFQIRCRAMEKLLESVIVPCQNAELGCTKNVPYGRESNHEKEYCKFSLCSCPELDHCHYTGSYVQCCRDPNGVYVTVNCIAPLAPEIGKFSYRISYSFNGHTNTPESPEMKKILGVSFQISHEKDFIFISNSLLRSQVLEMELCISEVE